ncbi:MAG: PaeR7I family type II restriction endonuclease [Coriobacteriia bacterium]|nr:PaeR7I family type II restriction endonuclease [Coriobacteriia bacterium]MCL2871204.1 PaeR7I family type II restriction endonuclease [Coriobacteriia bacterium]
MNRIEEALADIVSIRQQAAKKQREVGMADTGARSEVTGGAHLDAVTRVISEVFISAGIPRECIFDKRSQLELPGFFRAEKRWDIVIVNDRRLIAAVELKSIFGSYGNNINNRAEEAIGSAIDLAKAIRSGLVGSSSPWLGYVFIVKDDETLYRETKFRQPHFPVDEIFQSSSYLKRFEILCSRLVSERLYNNAWFVCLNEETGEYSEPSSEMTWSKFEAAIKGRVGEELA